MKIFWKELPIKQLCYKVIDYRGKTPPKVSSGIKLVTARVIKEGRILEDVKHEYISEYLYSEVMRRGIPQINDILITTEAPLGQIALVKTGEKIALAQRIILLRPNLDKVTPYFLYSMLRSPLIQSKLSSKATGTTVAGIKNQELQKVMVPIPTLMEQKKIANILACYDSLIENNLKQIKLLEELAQITYKEWFIHLRFPGYENTPINLDTGLPKNWGKVKLKRVIKLNYGKALKSDQRILGTIPVYGSSGIIGWHNESLVNGPGIVVGRKGNVGNVFWTENNFCPIDTVYFVTSKYSLHFIYFSLKQLKFDSHDAAVPGLNREAAYALEINLPNQRLLSTFSNYAIKIFSSIEILKKQNRLLKEARDILLPRLMTGLIDVEKYDSAKLLEKAITA
ncbi:MAG: restriction endonuclease subunit S [Rickettsiella sp.]|nr:restriction endonuclease subunit S [Rickettsiella sp.]